MTGYTVVEHVRKGGCSHAFQSVEDCDSGLCTRDATLWYGRSVPVLGSRLVFGYCGEHRPDDAGGWLGPMSREESDVWRVLES